jgi:hypothetical protein
MYIWSRVTDLDDTYLWRSLFWCATSMLVTPHHPRIAIAYSVLKINKRKW